MKLSRISLLFLHGIIGLILKDFSFFSTYIGLFIILVGTYYILGKPDPLEEYPLIFSSYIVGLEILLRMSDSKLFWEFGKYVIIYFLILGILRNSRKVQIYPPILSYFIFLLPAVIFVPLESLNSWRQDVAFNLSGPLSLTICSIYLYNRKINKDMLGKMLFFMILPIFSISLYNLFAMPDLSTYQFMPYSDFYTSGGYGPNQVSSIFGFGIVGLSCAQVLRIRVTGSKVIDLFLLMTFFGLGLITFSRGGIFTAIISFTCAISYFLFHEEKKVHMISKSFGLFIISVITWIAIISITDGVILQRYGFDTDTYGQRILLDLTGRAMIYKIDIEIFWDHLLTGVGPGQANDMRVIYGYGKRVAAHTEYSRMLAEHGILGLFSLLILIALSIYHFAASDYKSIKFVKILFGLLALLTMMHSAMRIALPGFAYGLIFLKFNDE